MFTSTLGAIEIADIIVLVVLGLGLVAGLIGGLSRAFKGIFATISIILVGLLLAGATVTPIVGSSLGQSLSGTLRNSTEGWGEAFTSPVYINRTAEGEPIKDGDNYTYYIMVADENGETKAVALESAADGNLVSKAKGKIALRLARRFIRPASGEDEGTEGEALAGIAADALTTLIFDIVLFVVYCIVLGVIFFLLRKLFKRMHDADSVGVKALDRVLGAVVATGLALLTVFLVFAIIKAAVPDGSKVAKFFEESTIAGALYKNNIMSGLLTKIFG